MRFDPPADAAAMRSGGWARVVWAWSGVLTVIALTAIRWLLLRGKGDEATGSRNPQHLVCRTATSWCQNRPRERAGGGNPARASS